MEVVSLEFNTLHGTRIYARSSAKVYFESYHSDNDMNATAVLAEAYTESPISIIIMYVYQMYLSSMDSYFTIVSVLQLR